MLVKKNIGSKAGILEEDDDDFDIQTDPADISKQRIPSSIHGFFFVVEKKRLIRIRFSEICCIEANKSYIYIQTTTERHLIVGSLARLERRLPTDIFCRIHRSWIVPLDGISVINRNKVLVNKTWYPLGTTFRGKLIEMLRPFIFNKRPFYEAE